MATLNQFQQYSQGENTITNNILLMFSLLYEINPRYFEEYINSLIEENNFYKIIPLFNQQVNNSGNGFIDGHISMPKSSIILETKIHGLENIEKLLKYTESFKEDEIKLLFHLSTKKFNNEQIEEINSKLHKNSKKDIKFYSLTYLDLTQQIRSLYHEYPYEAQLKRLLEHFESYCNNMKLLNSNKHILRAMACGQSFELNKKYKLYFDLASRGYSHFNYLGIYKWKAVRYIGKVENMIVADWNEIDGLIIKQKSHEITDDQKERLTNAILEGDKIGWGISNGHRFFLLKDFYGTNFLKKSDGGIFRVRYFNLENYLGKNMTSTVSEIAALLKDRFWEKD